MDIFNLIVKIIFFGCLGWSVIMLAFYFVRRHLERKKARKEIENENDRQENE